MFFQDTDDPSSQQVVQLQPQQEVKDHHLDPASLVLSPHHLWLASVGRDGVLRIRETASMVGSYSLNAWFIFLLALVLLISVLFLHPGTVHRTEVSFIWSW